MADTNPQAVASLEEQQQHVLATPNQTSHDFHERQPRQADSVSNSQAPSSHLSDRSSNHSQSKVLEVRTTQPTNHEIADVEKQGPTIISTEKPAQDPHLVDFSGLDDPYSAQSWTVRKKWGQVAVLSLMTFITPLASSMFAPGVPQVLADFHSSNMLLSSFVVSVYVLGYAVGPLVIAPLSELYGRVPLYHVTNGSFVVLTVACALSTNLNMLIGFRFLAGCAGSSVLTMGGGTIGDMFKQDERGGAMAIWSIGPLIGPVIGPVAGGFLSEAKGWRWVFWVLAIAVCIFSFFRESGVYFMLIRFLLI